MAGFAATDEAERTEDDEAKDRFTHGAGADADAAGEPGHGEAELEPAFETAVADEMRIDGAVGDGQAQSREEEVSELYPKMLDMGDPEKRVDSRKLKVGERQNPRKERHNTENTEDRNTKSTEAQKLTVES